MTVTDYVFRPPQYSADFFEEDELYTISSHLYHIIAIADTKFGRLAWATMEVNGKVDIQTLNYSNYLEADHVR